MPIIAIAARIFEGESVIAAKVGGLRLQSSRYEGGSAAVEVADQERGQVCDQADCIGDDEKEGEAGEAANPARGCKSLSGETCSSKTGAQASSSAGEGW